MTWRGKAALAVLGLGALAVAAGIAVGTRSAVDPAAAPKQAPATKQTPATKQRPASRGPGDDASSLGSGGFTVRYLGKDDQIHTVPVKKLHR